MHIYICALVRSFETAAPSVSLNENLRMGQAECRQQGHIGRESPSGDAMQGGREKDDTRVYDVDVCLIIGVVLRKGGTRRRRWCSGGAFFCVR